MIHIDTTNGIVIDGTRTALAVTQRESGTVVYTPESRLSGQSYVEHKMPHQRYSLAHDAPASGVAGRAQFETDVRQLIATLAGVQARGAMQRVLIVLLEECEEVVSAMERSAARTKSRPDYPDIVTVIAPLRQEIESIFEELEGDGIELEALKGRLTRLLTKAKESRLQIRKSTGIKSFAAVRW